MSQMLPLAMFPVGTKVRFKGPLERYPHFTVPDGTMGEVVDSDEEFERLVVKVTSTEVPGLTDDPEWKGEVIFCLPEGDDPVADLEVA